MSDVIRFNPDAYVCVHMLNHSEAVQVASNIVDEHVAKMYERAVIKNGGHVFKTCKAGVLIAALELIKEKASG
jgi:hypothetical protein